LKRGVLKSVITYSISLAVAAGLLWYVYKDFAFDNLLAGLKKADYRWIVASLMLSLISHWLRAYRWNLLLKPLGYHQLKTWRSFLAVMVMYFANLLLPRMGEISRCGILNRTDGVSVTKALGSVVTERLIDLLFLAAFIVVALVVEADVLSTYLTEAFSQKLGGIDTGSTYLWAIVGALTFLGVTGLMVLYFYWQQIKDWSVILKIRTVAKDLWAGMLSIRKVKERWALWSSSAAIWILYLFMSYVVFFALDATNHLDIWTGVSVLIMGGIGMSAPVQGGIGTYHILVSGILLVYGVPDNDGKLFAVLLHSSQTLFVIVMGLIALPLSLAIGRSKKHEPEEQAPTHPTQSTDA